jgi:hypothetical protein
MQVSKYIIQIRDDDEYKLGYPYNNKFDEIFKPLNNEEIEIYGLDNDDIAEINTLKTQFLNLDNNIFLLSDKIANFLNDINAKNDVVELYDKNQKQINEMELKKNDLKQKIDALQQEYDFVVKSSVELEDNIEEIKKLLDYYKNKLIQVEYQYSENYEADVKKNIDFYQNIISQRKETLEKLKVSLNEKIQEYTNEYKQLESYDDEKILIKDIYEKISLYSNINNNLYDYFKHKFDELWTYGESVIFDKKNKELESIKQDIVELNGKRIQYSNSKIDEEIELGIKNFSLSWLNNNKKFIYEDFIKQITIEKRNILEKKLSELEVELSKNEENKYVLFSKEQQENYFKYKEILHKKIQYEYNTLFKNNILDKNKIEEFDEEMNKYKQDYLFVRHRMFENTYYYFENDIAVLKSNIEHIKKSLEIINYHLKEQGNSINENDNQDVKKYIEFYQNEYDKYIKNKQELNEMKKKLLKNKANIETEMSVIKVNEQFIEHENKKLRKNYISYVDNIVEQQKYLKGSNLYIEYLSGELKFDIEEEKNKLDKIENQFFVDTYKEVKNELFEYYDEILVFLKKIFENKMGDIVQQEIFESKMLVVYKDFIDTILKRIKNVVYKFLFNKTYDKNILVILNEMYDVILKYINDYLKISKKIGKMYVEFDMDLIDENLVKIDLTELKSAEYFFNRIIKNNLDYIEKMNNEFRLYEFKQNEIKIINEVWEKI